MNQTDDRHRAEEEWLDGRGCSVVSRRRRGKIERAWRAVSLPSHHEAAVFGECHDAGVDVAVGDEQVPVMPFSRKMGNGRR
jgi:hypothetical protein